MAFVLSTKAHARIVKVDASAALEMPGVVDYVDHRSVPGPNNTGYYIIQDEEIFRQKKGC